jgi:hypothetical protein
LLLWSLRAGWRGHGKSDLIRKSDCVYRLEHGTSFGEIDFSKLTH